MQAIMPLFNFQYFEENEFAFSDGRLFIRSFVYDEGLADRDIFSVRDRAYMNQQAHHALVAESTDLKGYEVDANLLLMSFRILADRRTPMIKYRLSADDNFCSRMEDVEHHILLPGYLYQVYSTGDFPQIDATYVMLRQAEKTAIRLKNALFFVYRAFHSYHWTDAFLFHMSALEALFSLDTKGGVTKTICRRVSRLLDDPASWDEAVISDLYGVRSRMTHGRLEARPNSEENLRLLDQLERLTKLCFRKLIQNNSFQHYTTDPAREQFMKQLD